MINYDRKIPLSEATLDLSMIRQINALKSTDPQKRILIEISNTNGRQVQ